MTVRVRVTSLGRLIDLLPAVVAAIGTAVMAWGQAVALTMVIFSAHVALWPLSGWIERVAPPEANGPR